MALGKYTEDIGDEWMEKQYYKEQRELDSQSGAVSSPRDEDEDGES